MKDTLMGRAIGILIADGSDGAVIQEDGEGRHRCGCCREDHRPQSGGREACRWLDAGG